MKKICVYQVRNLLSYLITSVIRLNQGASGSGFAQVFIMQQVMIDVIPFLIG